ncbi:MAG: acyl-CoA synthetase [Sneathiellaceae bacterium]
MHPFRHAQSMPDKAAYIMAGSGEVVTYAQLDRRSNRWAQLFRARGLTFRDHIALVMENNARYFEFCWGAQRAGLYFTCISSRLTAAETAYIVRDCGARLVLTSDAMGTMARELAGLLDDGITLLALGGGIPGWAPAEPLLAAQPDTPIADEIAGGDMLYSSGTTGRPKGVKVELAGDAIDAIRPLHNVTAKLYDMSPEMTYLSPAPLYHAAPLRFNMQVQKIGGTCIVMEKFDAEAALQLIGRHRATHSQWVPTMFVRMLKLPEEVRAKHDVSSMRVAIHAAAPCPVQVKRQMIDWWGPVLYEYYAGSEGNGFCAITSAEWLAHEGSVGRALVGELHIVGEDGEEVPQGETGLIYFGNGPAFSYHNDPAKTAEASNDRGWTTLGDIGRVDAEGYLYLTDRKAFMIISGGVNIYPQETEDALITHPKVADVAVIGVPNEDFGEEVKAVVQPMDWADAGPSLAEELIAHCRQQLSAVKCPRSVDFERELPRHPTGKLYKRLLRDRYWGNRDSRIV